VDGTPESLKTDRQHIKNEKTGIPNSKAIGNSI
jgi:hypothetical protein